MATLYTSSMVVSGGATPFIINKLRAHVFYDGDDDAKMKAASLASKLFKDDFDISVKREAWTLSHVSS
jgi:hypothetical protein